MVQFYKQHKNLFYIALVSVLSVILFEFIFAKYTELFIGGVKVAEIIVNSSLSYIAALIFYILTIYIPSNEEKVKTAPLAEKTTNRILQKVDSFFPKNFKSEKLLLEDYSINETIFQNWLFTTKLNDDSNIGNLNMVGSWFTNHQALEQCLVRGILEEIDKTSFFIKNLEPDFIAKLYAIKRATICERIINYPASSFEWPEDETLGYYKDHLIDLLSRVSELVKTSREIYN